MWLHNNEREQGHYSGQVTPDGVIVAAALSAVLVSLSGVGIATTLRVAVVVRMLDVFGDLSRPVVHRGQTIKWTVGEAWEEGKTMIARGRRLIYPDNSEGYRSSE